MGEDEVQVDCPTCDGLGDAWTGATDRSVVCRDCHGRGWVTEGDDPMDYDDDMRRR